MADSDSDQFESADEDFTDHEDTETVKTLPGNDVDENKEVPSFQASLLDRKTNLDRSSLTGNLPSTHEDIDAPLDNEKASATDKDITLKLKSSGFQKELVAPDEPSKEFSSLRLSPEVRDNDSKSKQKTDLSESPKICSVMTVETNKSQASNSATLINAEKFSSSSPASKIEEEYSLKQKPASAPNDKQSCVESIQKADEANLESTSSLKKDLILERHANSTLGDKWGTKVPEEKNLDQLKSQSAITISETSQKSQLGHGTSNADQDLDTSSWNDGWETEDFEIKDDICPNESVSSKEKSPVPVSTKVEENDNAADWDEGWDTEEISFENEQSIDQSGLKKEFPEAKEQKSETEGSSSQQKHPADPKSFPTQGSVERRTESQLSGKTTDRSGGSDQSKTLQTQQQQQDGWFGWGVTNILSTATEGLSSITTNVSTVFESTIGVPDPEDILRAQKEARLKEEAAGVETAVAREETSGFTDNLFSVSSWTKFVESTGSKVLTTGLDTLETIGKKTMEVLQEGDPGLKKKRAKLREFVSEPGKPVLSQILREAKEKAETSSAKNEAALIASRANFEILFDDFGGLVHLEALEMISKQCQIKLESLALTFSGDEARNFKETLDEIEEFCELPEDDESNSKDAVSNCERFLSKVTEVLAELKIEIQLDKLSQTSAKVESRLEENFTNSVELHQIVISSLAEISAAAMQIFHRAAEMLVIKSKHSTVAETESLMGFGKLMCSKLDVTAEKFSSKLKMIDPQDTAKVSHIMQEASNSTSYIQTACRLCLPILQYGAVA